jgi:cation transporter-like permease
VTRAWKVLIPLHITSPALHADDSRLFPRIDRLFALFVALELLAFPLALLGPLVVAGVASVTSLRRSRWRILALWIVAAVLTAIVLVPFVTAFFGAQFVDEGPVHQVG